MAEARVGDQTVSTDAVVELLRRDVDTAFTIAGEGSSRLKLTPGAEPFVVNSGDLLVDVDLALPVAEARVRCQRAGVWLPLPDTGGSLLELLVAAPALCDAFVRDLDGLDRRGARCASPSSPRAAVGPDLIGGALLPSLWLLPLRARLRVLSITRSRIISRPTKGARASATMLKELMDEGRAFVVAATADEVRVTRGSSESPTRRGAVPATQPLPVVRFGRSVALRGFDTDDVESRLLRGELLVGAPQQGRLIALEGGAPRSVVFGPTAKAAHAFATALTSTKKSTNSDISAGGDTNTRGSTGESDDA